MRESSARTRPWSRSTRTPPGGFHLVPDAVGGPRLKQVIHRLAPAATVVLYGNRGGGYDDFALREFYQAGAFNARVIAFISTVPEETKGEDLAILARLSADGRLRPQIGWTGEWTRTTDVLAALAQRAFTKAVLTIPHKPAPLRRKTGWRGASARTAGGEVGRFLVPGFSCPRRLYG